jgi:uncharacterized protein (TIGR02646 family)
MIFIDRRRVPRPKQLDAFAESSFKQLADFYEREAVYKLQRSAKFPGIPSGIVMKSLLRLFHSKCAFCERPFGSEEANCEQFRPKSGAMNLDRSVSKDHYWWLAYEWENLYPVCKQCSRHKGTRFPVQRARATPRSRGNQLLEEGPLLLDPCNADDAVEQSLRFDANGIVHGANARGEVTIEVLGLNRTELVSQRQKYVAEVLRLLDVVKGLGAVPQPAHGRKEHTAAANTFRQLRKRLTDSTPFAALHRQLIRPVLDEPVLQKQIEKAEQAGQISEEDNWVSIAGVVVPKRAWPRDVGAVWIDRIEIDNFKAIRHLELSFPEVRDATTEPWIVLLGENGVGKSSILQAIALVMMDADNRQRYIPNAAACVNNQAEPPEGVIRL